MALKPMYRNILYAVAAVVLIGGGKLAWDSGLIPRPATRAAAVPEKASLPQGIARSGEQYELTAQPVSTRMPCLQVDVIPWQATGSLNLANGGPQTTEQSFVTQYAGGCLKIVRKDFYSDIQNDLAVFAEERRKGVAYPTKGAAFAIIMGDGTPYFFLSMKDDLTKMGQAIKIISGTGYSAGEDKFMAPPEVLRDPQKARGLLVAGVPMDGDQNILMKWAGDNGILFNPDPTTYDKNAINFLPTGDFAEADDKFNTNFCEERFVANGDVKSTEKVKVCVNAVVTWTPGDHVVVAGRGGVVTIASTKEYSSQMPATLIGNDGWMKDNRRFVVGLLKAIDRGSFEINAGDAGVQRMARVNADIFGEFSAQKWAQYFAGYDETDRFGNTVNIGGSRVINLVENAELFGLRPGSINIFKSVCTIFGGYHHKYYPQEMTSLPNCDEMVDTSYLKEALKGVSVGQRSDPRFDSERPIQEVVSKRVWAIEFETGSATLTAESIDVLYELRDQVGITNLRIRIDGHTDNVGDEGANQRLSEARAKAVADFLYRLAPGTFPLTRMDTRGYGEFKPLAGVDPNTAAGQRRNRRVEIVLGN